MEKPTLLCVDDERMVLDSLKEQLRRFFGEEYQIETASSGTEALELMDALSKEETEIPIIISDHIMPGIKGDELLKRVHSRFPDTLTILLTGRADADAVGNAVNEGNLYRYITKPWEENDLVLTIKEGLRRYVQDKQLEQQNKELAGLFDQAKEEIERRKKAESSLKKAYREIKRLQEMLQEENTYLRQEIKLTHNFEEIIGNSDPLKYVLYRVEQVAPNDTTVLIQGETGTGKELIARAIHQASPRNQRPLIKVDCATLPAELIESELFGHEKGAFTGAFMRKTGHFELAHKGTLFLDEIGELPIRLQAKLLRAIEYGEFERLGNPKPIKVDARIIAATNRNLEDEVHAGNFRKDLFYRLNVYPVSIPPLRKRSTDIPLLVDTFVRRFSKKMGKPIPKISQKAIQALSEYTWPGNIRELENIIERAIVLSNGKTLNIEIPKQNTVLFEELQSLEQIEKEYILKVLDKTKGKISGDNGAAKILGLHPNTLRSRMEKLNIKFG